MFTYRQYSDILNIEPKMSDDISPVPSTTPSVSSVEKRFGGLYNKHIYYHQYPNTLLEIPRSLFHRNFGYGIACAGFGLSLFVCVLYYKSANVASTAAYEVLMDDQGDMLFMHQSTHEGGPSNNSSKPLNN